MRQEMCGLPSFPSWPDDTHSVIMYASNPRREYPPRTPPVGVAKTDCAASENHPDTYPVPYTPFSPFHQVNSGPPCVGRVLKNLASGGRVGYNQPIHGYVTKFKMREQG